MINFLSDLSEVLEAFLASPFMTVLGVIFILSITVLILFIMHYCEKDDKL